MRERWSRNAAEELTSGRMLKAGIRARRQAATASARRAGVKVLMHGTRIPVVRPFAELGMQVLFDGLADRWDDIRADPTYREGMLDAYRRLPDGFTPRRILDIACGTGQAAALAKLRWPGAEVRGCDISPKMVELARERVPNVEFEVAGARSLPALDDSVDLVTALDGIVYAPELARVLAPEGRALIAYSKSGTTPISRPLDEVAIELAAESLASEQHTDGPAHVLVVRRVDERRRARRR